MNMFFEYTGITGKVEVERLNHAMREFLELAYEIRRELGKQAYLLDKYISFVLKGAGIRPFYAAAERGFHISSELRHIIISSYPHTTHFIYLPIPFSFVRFSAGHHR